MFKLRCEESETGERVKFTKKMTRQEERTRSELCNDK